MANSKVPQFGAWGADENVGYTAYFETARKGKSGGPMINPNDPQMNSDILPPARPAPPPPQRATPESKKPKFGEWEAEEEVPYTTYFENTRKGNNKTNPNDPQMNRDTPPQAQPKKPESKQPKFGEWEAEEEVPYTAYFENTGKGNKRNPNEPQMNRDHVPHPARPATPPQPTETKQPKFGEWDDGGEVPYTAYFESTGKGKRNPNEPQMNRDVGPSAATKPAPSVANASVRSGDPKPNVVKFDGGMGSVEQSPIHPRVGGGRGAPVRGAHNPVGQGASIPAFGDWNKNPGQADGYTGVFDQLQKDRRDGPAGATPSRDTRPPAHTPGRGSNPPHKGDDCFSRFFRCFSG